MPNGAPIFLDDLVWSLNPVVRFLSSNNSETSLSDPALPVNKDQEQSVLAPTLEKPGKKQHLKKRLTPFVCNLSNNCFKIGANRILVKQRASNAMTFLGDCLTIG